MKPGLIKTEEKYNETLARIEELMDVPEGDPLEDELELLVHLVEKYEEEQFPIDLPDPVDAILFRKEQAGLSNSDLIQYIGSQSKVSEVLNRKRPLSLSMIRALHDGLGIPAEVLLNEPGSSIPGEKYSLADFPFTEMFNRGYFSSEFKKLNTAKDQFEECLAGFFKWYESNEFKICCRQSDSKFGLEKHLQAWQARLLNIVSEETLVDFDLKKLDKSFLHEAAHLSYYNQGVLLVREALNRIGIHFVILKHLPKTYLDGACFFSPSGNPVVAMTLRYDRLDNFWFTLLHELAHIFLGHVSPDGREVIIDDTNNPDKVTEIECEANDLAFKTFIPEKKWNESLIKILNEEISINDLAEEYKISPSIIAGRIRFESEDYTKYNDLIGQGQVRKYFEFE